MVLALAGFAAARPPDVLVSADARLIAIRAPPRILLVRAPKAQAYTLAAWQPVWGGAMMSPLDPTAPPRGAICTVAFCQFATPNLLIALSPPRDGCGAAMAVVSPIPLRGACRAPGRLVIDRFTVWRDGAAAIWFTRDGPRILTDRRVQGSRPWVQPWPSWSKATLD